MTTDSTCSICKSPKVAVDCDMCGETVCKKCSHFLVEGSFNFWLKVPEELTHTHYCSACYSANVEPAFERYNEIMERAKGLFFFFTTQRKALPVLKKSKESVHVTACADRDETVMRLAFQAAEQGYTAVLEAEVKCKKVRDEGYQHSVWTGVGIPAMVDVEKLHKWDIADRQYG